MPKRGGWMLCLAITVCMGVMSGQVFGQKEIPSEPLKQGGPAKNQIRLTINDAAVARNGVPRLADTLVLCPESFQPALKPWLGYRRNQGHLVAVIPPAGTAYSVKRQIRDIAAFGNLKSVLLIGDTPAANRTGSVTGVPTDYVPAKVISEFGSEPEIATDNTYADLNDDDLPELAIGRLPVDSADSLAVYVRKIIDYERQSGGEWQRRINMVAGTGGFGPLPDTVIEQTSRRLISDLIPSEYSTTMTYANWASAYCPDPRQFIPVTLKRLNEGSLFWVYMGHGHPNRLDHVRTPYGGFPMLRESDISFLNCKQGHPIALMLACYSGAFDFPKDCIAEKMVNEPGGPIAVVCGSRVTMPAGMSLLSVGLIEEYFDGDKPTLGEIFLASKRKMIVAQSGSKPATESSSNRSRYREILEMLGKTLSPSGDDLNAEAKEHVHLFHLLGDPLLRVKRPESLPLAVETSDDGTRLTISGTAQYAGDLKIELVYSRDRFQKRPPRRLEFKWDKEFLASFREIYRRSNVRTVSEKTVRVDEGQFELQLPVPEWARGRCAVRGYLQRPEQKRYSLGASPLNIKRR